MFNKKVTVWINGGDSSFPMKVKKGTRIWLSGGHSYIAGSKSEKRAYLSIKEIEFYTVVYEWYPMYLRTRNRTIKLDLKTMYMLLKMGVKVSNSIPFNLDKNFDSEYAHAYKDYDEFKRVITYFVPNIRDEMIRSAILLVGSKGQIVALDKACFDIISKIREEENQIREGINNFEVKKELVEETKILEQLTQDSPTHDLQEQVNYDAQSEIEVSNVGEHEQAKVLTLNPKKKFE